MASNRLLIVDDDEYMGEVLAELGRQVGYETRWLSDSSAARQELAAWTPSVIITDLQMPAFDGVAFLRMLATDVSRAKIVIVSGMDRKLIEMAGELSRHRGLDIAGMFTKPFVVAELRACLVALRQQQPIPATEVVRALQCDEFKVFLQPKCEIDTGRPLGAEALARWISPERGIVSPAAFLPQVASAGLSDVFFDRMLTDSLVAATKLRRGGLIDIVFQVAVNMTAENLLNLSLPDRVRAICELHGWPMQNLTLELTETASMDGSHDAVNVLTRLRLMSVKLSIDDFGTGYSSLLRLRQLPFTEIKIDQAFVSRIVESRDSSVIVRTILTMAENLSLDPVAEGVESHMVSRELRSMGCQIAQGFYFSEPLSAEDFDLWLASDTEYDGAHNLVAERLAPTDVPATVQFDPHARMM